LPVQNIWGRGERYLPALSSKICAFELNFDSCVVAVVFSSPRNPLPIFWNQFFVAGNRGLLLLSGTPINKR
jgi:hypothetical protein